MKVKKEKKIKKKKNNNIIAYIILSISVIICGFCLYKIYEWQVYNKNTQNALDEINNLTQINEVSDNENTEIINPPKEKFDPYWDYIKIPLIDVDFTNLLKTNKDTVGWLFVDGTNINYPVVQGTNNSYYLMVSFDNKYNDAGWIFMDYRNNPKNFDNNTIIYGHSRYDKSMFGSLRNITKNSWYKDTNNHIIKFSTPTSNTLWQVFSVYTIEAESYYITTNFANDNEFKEWLDTMIKRSVYDFKTTVDINDKILTLSSCYTSDGIRVVLQAKLIKSENRN